MMQFATSCQVSEMQDAISLLANRTPGLQRLGRNSVDVGAFKQAKHEKNEASGAVGTIITGMKLDVFVSPATPRP
jgi:hypothetical protein